MCRKSLRAAIAAVIAGSFLHATPTLASSGGVTSNNFPDPPQGCNFCHGGGLSPTVELVGPTSVAPSSTNEYTLRVFEIGDQAHAGLNVEAADGVLATGGSASAQTQAMTNPVSSLAEITHTGQKPASGGVTEFSFLWTAPASFTNVTITGWGNAVDFNGGTAGDQAAVATLVVSNNSVPTPSATATATPTPTSTPLPQATCPATPAGGCRTAGKGVVKLLDKTDDNKDLFLWKWIKGAATTQTELGADPVGGSTSYAICAYDETAGTPNLSLELLVNRGGDLCSGKPCFKSIGGDPPGGKGWKYKDKPTSADGVLKLVLKGGDAGRAKIIVKAKGTSLPLPGPASGTAYFNQDAAVTVQLLSNDGGACFESTFTTPAKKSEAEQFKDKL